MKRERENQTCYLCGVPIIKNKKNREGNSSPEHIPPKCVFPVHLRHQLITVPCCKTCNNGHADTDELLLFNTGDGFNQMEVPEVFERLRKSVREGALRKHWPSIWNSIKPGPLGMDWMKFPPHMRETMPRIAKGLLYKFLGIRDFTAFTFNMCCMNAAMRDLMLAENADASFRRIERGSGVFRADIMTHPDVRHLGCIWIQLYKGTVYYLFYLSPEPVNPLLEGFGAL